MEHNLRIRGGLTAQLRESVLAPYRDVFVQHLAKGGYASGTIGRYLACIAHFAHWLGACQLNPAHIDEAMVRQFLDGHLPGCACPKPACQVRNELRAALGHLLVVLRAEAVIAEALVATSPVDEELRRFDAHMERVQGLAPRTRRGYLRPVGWLLREQFSDGPVSLTAIGPEDLREFFARQCERYSTSASISTLTSALRGYFRYRASCGDLVHRLIGVVTYPANWQQASLPEGLSDAEVKRLVGALDHEGRSARRDAAMVRCALDLGLRSCEVATLGLDDIDWRAGTVTLRKTKSRREDVLPLPRTTGSAIAAYLKFERPRTRHRAVFARLVAPRERPIGPDLVRKTIRQAYGRAGLPHTRAHLLRYTMASRLLERGRSLKEVADVLRHRSLNTTLVYAKLDSRNLTQIALPWPRCAP